jgi:hypothetical protein
MVEITGGVITDYRGKTDGVFELHAVPTQAFTAADATIVEPKNPRIIPVVVQNRVLTGNETSMTVPQLVFGSFLLYATNNAIVNKGATYRFELWRNNRKVMALSQYVNVEIPSEVESISWSLLATYNNPTAPPPVDRSVFSREQILDLFGEPVNIGGRVTALEVEMSGARQGQPALDTRLDAIDSILSGLGSSDTLLGTRVTNLENEITAARQGSANLDARLDVIDARTSPTHYINEYGSLAAAITALSIPGSSVVRLVVPTLQTLTTNVDVPSYITIECIAQGGFTAASALTLTLRGGFISERVQRFFGSLLPKFTSAVEVWPEWWGAKMDAELFAAAATTTASSTTLTITGRPATTADINNKITVYGAGAISPLSLTGLNNALRTSIASTSGSNFVTAIAASASVVSARVVIGTDDTTAFQRAADSLLAGGVIKVLGNSMLGAVTLSNNTTVYSKVGASMLYSTANSCLIFSSRTNITIDGVSIDACGNPLGNGAITMIGGTVLSRVRVKNCFVTDTFLTNNLPPVATFNRHAVLFRDQTDCWILNNIFEHSLRIKAAGGNIGESNTWIVGNILRDTNENGISLLTGQIVTVRDFFIMYNLIDGIAATGNGITIGDDDGGTTGHENQQFINIFMDYNIFKGALKTNTSYIQDKGSGVERNISICHNKFDAPTGIAPSNTFGINKANQSTPSQTINFKCIGNELSGSYDNAGARIGNVGSGIISENVLFSGQGGRGIRVGSSTNLKIRGNVITGYGTGIQLNAGVLDNIEIERNTINLLAQDNVVGVYFEPQTSPVGNITLLRNRVNGAGAGWHNVYGIQDDSNNNGNTNNIEYIETKFTNIDITTGLGSRYYQTLPTHALVIEAISGSAPTVITSGATPDVRGKREIVFSHSGATTVTDLLNGSPNQELRIFFTNGNATIQSGTNIILARDSGGNVVNFVPTAEDTLTLKYMSLDGGTTYKWREVSRSIN